MMRIRSEMMGQATDALTMVSALSDPYVRRVLRRHARTAALALRAPEAYVILETPARRVVAASYGRADDSRSPDLPLDLDPDDAVAGDRWALGTRLPAGGEEIGTLWVRDPARRSWSRSDRRLLAQLAESASEELKLRVLLSVAQPMPEALVPTDDAEALDAEVLVDANSDRPLLPTLREAILAAVHRGRAAAGTRLPSIREVAERSGATRYAVVQAYRSLEAEGIVEKRNRSGIYVASCGESAPHHLPETARWLGRVLTESYVHQVKLPTLPDLIRRWTASTPIRCGCVESSEDYRAALGEEIRSHFGLEAVPVPVSATDGRSSAARPVLPRQLLRSLDMLVTTPYHAPHLRWICRDLDLPIIAATLDDDSVGSPFVQMAGGRRLTLICVERGFAERMVGCLDPEQRSRVRVVLVDDAEAIERLDRSEPVLMTDAARVRLAGQEFRLLAAHYPSFSRRFAERVAQTILQLNLDRLNGRRPSGSMA